MLSTAFTVKNSYQSVRSHLVSSARTHIGSLYGITALATDAERLQHIDELLADDAYILREDERTLVPGVSCSIIRTLLSVTSTAPATRDLLSRISNSGIYPHAFLQENTYAREASARHL